MQGANPFAVMTALFPVTKCRRRCRTMAIPSLHYRAAIGPIRALNYEINAP